MLERECCKLSQVGTVYSLQVLWEDLTELVHWLLLVANAQCLSLFATLQMAQMCSLVFSSRDTGPQTSLPRVGGTEQLSSSCTLPVLRQQPWLPLRPSLFKPPCLTYRSLGTCWLLCLASTQHASPRPSTLYLPTAACNLTGATWKVVPVFVKNVSTVRILRCYWAFIYRLF